MTTAQNDRGVAELGRHRLLVELEIVPQRSELTERYVRTSGATRHGLDVVVEQLRKVVGPPVGVSGNRALKRREFELEGERLICLEEQGVPGCQVHLQRERGASLEEAMHVLEGIELVGELSELTRRAAPSRYRAVFLRIPGWSMKAYGQFEEISPAIATLGDAWLRARGLVPDAEGWWRHPDHPRWLAHLTADQLRVDLEGGPLES
jgi:hypothetical protein